MSDEENAVADLPVADPVPDPVPDIPIPDPTPDPVPDVPVEDVVVEAPKPVRWLLVEYRALAGAVLPLEAAGKFWHANSQHVISDACFARVASIPGFAALKDVPAPADTAGCAGCGG